MVKTGPVPEEATDARLTAFHRERASVRDDFLDGICEGPGAPGRLMRLVGPLGSGRTTLLGIWHGLQKMKDGRHYRFPAQAF